MQRGVQQLHEDVVDVVVREGAIVRDPGETSELLDGIIVVRGDERLAVLLVDERRARHAGQGWIELGPLAPGRRREVAAVAEVVVVQGASGIVADHAFN